MRKAAFVALCVLFSGVAMMVQYSRHATVLERNMVVDFKASEIQHDGIRVVRISGLCGHNSMSVYNITAQRSNSSIIVNVYTGLVLKRTSGYFRYDVRVPDGVNDIRFGKAEDVIWRRDAGGSH
jgi:hypothetical protein